MELFAKIVNSWKLLSILAKKSILNVWQGSRYTFLTNTFWGIAESHEQILDLNIFAISEMTTYVLNGKLAYHYRANIIHFWSRFNSYTASKHLKIFKNIENTDLKWIISTKWKQHFNPLSANLTKWSITLKQFVEFCRRIVWVCLTILWG